jgi:hypothetical protein
MREAISPLMNRTLGIDLSSVAFDCSWGWGVCYLLTTRMRFMGRGGVVVDIVAVAIDSVRYCYQ